MGPQAMQYICINFGTQLTLHMEMTIKTKLGTI